MNDPYLNPATATQRLCDEWIKYGKIIIALDFDDTIYDYHQKGHTYTEVIGLIRRCAEAGAYICVFTGTPRAKWNSIHAYMAELGIPLASINENPFPLPFGNDGKMYYNILLDDRAGLGQAVVTLNLALQHYLTYRTT